MLSKGKNKSKKVNITVDQPEKTAKQHLFEISQFDDMMEQNQSNNNIISPKVLRVKIPDTNEKKGRRPSSNPGQSRWRQKNKEHYNQCIALSQNWEGQWFVKKAISLSNYLIMDTHIDVTTPKAYTSNQWNPHRQSQISHKSWRFRKKSIKSDWKMKGTGIKPYTNSKQKINKYRNKFSISINESFRNYFKVNENIK